MEAKKKKSSAAPRYLICCCCLFFIVGFSCLVFVSVLPAAEAKRRMSVPDELDDVVDEEEDEDWKEWGKKKLGTSREVFDPPPSDLSKMSLSEIQAEMLKRHYGPSLGFVKLRFGVPRSREDVPQIAMKWSKVLRTGSIEAKFFAVDLNTIMFNMEKGQDTEELKGFILNQPEAYEMKIGDQIYRRPGDPPLDEVVEMLRRQKTGAEDSKSVKDPESIKNEL